MQELRASNPELALRAIVLNRIVRQKRVGQKSACPNCRRRTQATRSATAQLRKDFKSAKLYIGEDPGAPVLGIDGLGSFGLHVFEGKPLKLNPVAPKTKPRTGDRKSTRLNSSHRCISYAVFCLKKKKKKTLNNKKYKHNKSSSIWHRRSHNTFYNI